jgi:hypothetical protein
MGEPKIIRKNMYFAAANRVFFLAWQLALHLAGFAAPSSFDFSTGSWNVSYFHLRVYNQSGIPVFVVWCLSFPCELIGPGS